MIIEAKEKNRRSDLSQLQEYKCPCCGGAIAFDANLQKMKCPYCDTEFEMETLVSYDNELKQDTDDSKQWHTNAGGEWEENAMTMNPMVAGSRLVGAQADAMRTAAANEGGAMQGFMGMGMAMNAGGMNAQNLFSMGQQQQTQAYAQQMIDTTTQKMREVAASTPEGWKCACGAVATGKFCPECGAKKPEP